MKIRFDRVVPETPESFHNVIENTLAQTAANARRTSRVRPSAVLAAALVCLLLAGSAFAVGAHLGLWDFLSMHSRREIPSAVPPETETVNASVSSDDYVFTVLEAYREGRTVTIFAQLEQPGVSMTNFLPWESVAIRTENDHYLEVLDEQTTYNGVSCHVLTCALPEDAPETTTLYVSLDWYAKGDIPVTVTRRDVSTAVDAIADHMTLEGTGLTFTDIRLETTALNRTLTLQYTFDPAALSEPTLPSPYLTYHTCGDTYHTKADCPALTGTPREIELKDIVRESLTACSEPGCTFFTEAYEPLPDGIYLELLDAEGNLLPCASLEEQAVISPNAPAQTIERPGGKDVLVYDDSAPESQTFETTFLLDGLPDTLQLRAYDCWTKYRWQDTITLTLPQ